MLVFISETGHLGYWKNTPEKALHDLDDGVKKLCNIPGCAGKNKIVEVCTLYLERLQERMKPVVQKQDFLEKK